MNVPVLTFFNNKSGVGKTSLVYHLSWMLSRLGIKVLVCDLDPQANLTAAFLEESELEEIWDGEKTGIANTIYRAIEPLTKVGDIKEPVVRAISDRLDLIPGDLALSGFEDAISGEWSNAMGSGVLYRPFRILTAFWQAAQMGAKNSGANIIIYDVGPNLGAINRSAILSSDYVIVPLGTDIFSLQGLKNLGPMLRRWKVDWAKRKENWHNPEFNLPVGDTKPIGYVVQQHGVRLSRPVKAFDKWVNRIPAVYADMILEGNVLPVPATPAEDPKCLATLKHYHSLMPMGQERRKPIFELTSADGAIGNHAQHVAQAKKDFDQLAKKIAERIGVDYLL